MLNTTYDLVGVGSPIVDVLARVPDTFLQQVGGEKGGMVLVDAAAIGQWMAALPDGFAEAPGGSSGNTVFAASRLGLRTTFVGKTGNDTGGEFYRRRFGELGGDASRFKIAEQPNGRCLSLITPDSERTMRTDLGAAATLAPEEVTPADFIGCRHAHIEGYLLFNEALMRAVLEAAKSSGCTISVDLASFEVVGATREILPDILRDYVDVVLANEEEAAAYLEKEESPEAMARELGKVCDLAVVKAGADGAWIVRGKETVFAPALSGIQPVDTTGAGDYWAAGFLSGWLKGKPLETCGHWGSILGAEIVQVIGASLDETTWERIMPEFR